MAEMFNCTQGNIYAIEASGRDLTDEQLNILKSKFGDEVETKYNINLTLDKDNTKTFKESTHDFFNKREESLLAIIESQQRTIENLSKTLETLSKR